MNLMDAMKQVVSEERQSSGAVLAEFDTTSTELHKIANGDCCTLFDGQFGLRFLLKDSFKSPRSSFVINKYKIQFIINNKPNFMRKEEIAVKTKVIKGKLKITKKEIRPEIKLQVDNKQTELWGD